MAEIILGVIIGGLALATMAVAIGPGGLRRFLSHLIPKYDPHHFACRILNFEEEAKGEYADVLKIQMRGRIAAGRDFCDTDLQLHLADVSESSSEPKPVLCRRAEWSTEESPAFEYRFHNGVLPARVSLVTDWVTVAELREEELVFPHRGPRCLECTVSVLNRQSGKVLASAKGRINIVSQMRGYEEIQQQRRTKRTAILHLAASVWELTERTGEGKAVLQQWFSGLSSAGRDSLEDALQNLRDEIYPREDSIGRSCDELLGWADPSDRYQAMELCLKIAAAGAAIPAVLLEKLREIAEKLEIPEDRMQGLREKYLASQLKQIKDPLALLGLNERMSEEEIRQKLTCEYRKWNSRVTHPDPSVRQQADQMLNLITELRSRYASTVRISEDKKIL